MPTREIEQTSAPYSIWTALLSSSIILAGITGIFYFVGGAQYEGKSYVLGLYYLAGLQPAEYIFAGAELLLIYVSLYTFLIPTFIVIVGVGFSSTLRIARSGRYFPRKWETLLFLAFILFCGLIVLVAAFRAHSAHMTLIGNVCPVTPHRATDTAWMIGCSLLTLVWIFAPLFWDRTLRLSLIIWGVVMFLFCLYNFGWLAGADQVYSSQFLTAEISSPSVAGAKLTKVMILGSDSANLVILVTGEINAGHPAPRYVQRSDLKTFRIVGSSTINNFFCKSVPYS